LFEFIAGVKYKTILYFITAMYTYHPDTDIYIPKYEIVDGRVMRGVMENLSGTALARESKYDGEILVPLGDDE
jgi:hypothetical protein